MLKKYSQFLEVEHGLHELPKCPSQFATKPVQPTEAPNYDDEAVRAKETTVETEIEKSTISDLVTENFFTSSPK